mgnify:CR=1 FL=1|tara:strand:+ start:1546 stop:1761 length:216 start_codon:yes stop_codon:yes gene_type:complete
MTNSEVKELINAITLIGDVEYALDSQDVMGHDDITGMTPNSNLALIAVNLENLNTTLEKIADIMVINTKLD